MGIVNKAKNTVEKAVGEVKEVLGEHTDDKDLQAEGKKDQVSGDLKNAG